MLPTAHIASALLVQRLAGIDADAPAAVAGSLLPDVIDKTLAWVLKVAPSGRHIAHTPLAAALLSLTAVVMFGRKRGASFGVAYGVHLVADLWHGGRVPWLMPLREYHLQSQPWRADFSRGTLLLEAAATAAIVLLARTRQGDRPEATAAATPDAPP